MHIDDFVKTLHEHTRSLTPPLIDLIVTEFGHDPYRIMIACLLSLRAKDSTTIHVCRELFVRAKTPHEMLDIPIAELEKILFRTGFYKNKTQVVRSVSHDLITRFAGTVPDTYEQLMSITGVGPKTANLVLGAAFYTPAVCVDTHVHRISNRLGLIKTKTVEESEQALKRVLPKKYWNTWNNLLVMWGQNVCVPISPKCSGCPVRVHCKRIGVDKSR